MDNQRSGAPIDDRVIYWTCVILGGTFIQIAAGLQYLARHLTIAARQLIRIAHRHR